MHKYVEQQKLVFLSLPYSLSKIYKLKKYVNDHHLQYNSKSTDFNGKVGEI